MSLSFLGLHQVLLSSISLNHSYQFVSFGPIVHSGRSSRTNASSFSQRTFYIWVNSCDNLVLSAKSSYCMISVRSSTFAMVELKILVFILPDMQSSSCCKMVLKHLLIWKFTCE